MPSQAWNELRGLGFRTDTPRSSPGLFDLDPVPGREGVYAGSLPSAPTDHAPRTDDYPAGWTVQHPYGRVPDPTLLACGVCGAADTAIVHACRVLDALSALEE